MKKNWVLCLILFLLILPGYSQSVTKRYFNNSRVYISLPSTFILGTSKYLTDFTQDKPNIVIVLTVKQGTYSENINKMLAMITPPLLLGTSNQLIKDIIHRGTTAKYVTFDQVINELIPTIRQQHIIFGYGTQTFDIQAMYDVNPDLDKVVESYLLSAGYDYE